MGLFTGRIKKIQYIFDELEHFLTEKGATPCHFFKDTNILNYLACVPFNDFLNSLNLTRVNIDLQEEEMAFVNFILLYKKIRGKKINPLLDTPPDTLCYDSPTLGWRENPTYEEELKRYRMKLAKPGDPDEPVFSDFPCKKKPVYIRLTYEGQVFIKSK